jgi:hypothetical protein
MRRAEGGQSLRRPKRLHRLSEPAPDAPMRAVDAWLFRIEERRREIMLRVAQLEQEDRALERQLLEMAG